MANEEQVSLRLPVEILQRADRLAPPIAQKLTTFRITRAAVLRLALERGLAQLEEEHRPAKRKR